MSDWKCPSCGFRMADVLFEMGLKVHPNCECSHGYVGKKQCPLCRVTEERKQAAYLAWKAEREARANADPQDDEVSA